MDWLRIFLEQTGVPVGATESDLKLPARLLGEIAARYQTPRPWIVLALGASHPDKDWPDAHWTALIDTLAEALVDVWHKLGLPLKDQALAAE